MDYLTQKLHVPGVGQYDISEHRSINFNSTKTSFNLSEVGASRKMSNEPKPGPVHNPKLYISEVGEREFLNKEGPGVAIYNYERCMDERSPKKKISFTRVSIDRHAFSIALFLFFAVGGKENEPHS